MYFGHISSCHKNASQKGLEYEQQWQKKQHNPDKCYYQNYIYQQQTHTILMQILLYKILLFKMSPIKRICVFEHSVMTNFNCACPAIQWGQGSGFLSEGSSWLTACMSEQRRFWQDCADAQARLNLRCSHRRYVPNSLDTVQIIVLLLSVPKLPILYFYMHGSPYILLLLPLS